MCEASSTAVVRVGTILRWAARDARGSSRALSSSDWPFVYEWTVVIMPSITPTSSCSTFATGARHMVDAVDDEMIWCCCGS